jgi:long-chain acyl-CoA synthetase
LTCVQVLQEVAAANPLSRTLFNTAFARKRRALDKGDSNGGLWSPFWNALVFSKVKAKLGGRVRLLTTGASPISPDVMAFLRICFPGALVLEGYGPLPHHATKFLGDPSPRLLCPVLVRLSLGI